MPAQNGLHAHAMMIKEAVRRFGLGKAAASLRDIGLRLGKKIPRQNHRPIAQPLVGQPGTSQFFLRPIQRRRHRGWARLGHMDQSPQLGQGA